jgi:glyoxalase-like protein
VLAAEPGAWAAAGFEVEDGVVRAGAVRVRLAGEDAGRGIVSWSLRDAPTTDVDGLPTIMSHAAPAEPAEHPNGVTRIDHVVVVTPDLERTTAALAAAGIACRRVREVPMGEGRALHQGFFRLGEVILEVVDGMPLDPAAEPAPGAPAAFWGLVFVVADLDAAGTQFGDRIGTPRDAVQPGQRIATVRREAGLGLPVALISGG